MLSVLKYIYAIMVSEATSVIFLFKKYDFLCINETLLFINSTKHVDLHQDFINLKRELIAVVQIIYVVKL